MNPPEKIDDALRQQIEKLSKATEITCLVYPANKMTDLKSLMERKEKQGFIEYNELYLAGCFAVRTSVQLVFELADEDVVGRIAANPTFKTN